MTSRIAGTVLILSFSSGFLPTKLLAEEDLRSIAIKAIEASNKHKTIHAKLVMRMDAGSAAQTMTSLGTGTYEHLVEGSVVKFRMDLENTLTAETDAKKITTPVSTISIVCDGPSVFTLTDNLGDKNAIKNIGRANQSFAACKEFFAALFQDNAVKLLPDEKQDGKDVWVIEAQPKSPKRGQVAKTVHYILKDCGLRVKTTGHDPNGVRIQLSLLTEIKLDAPIKPERFVFKIPPGVRVVDLSRSK